MLEYSLVYGVEGGKLQDIQYCKKTGSFKVDTHVPKSKFQNPLFKVLMFKIMYTIHFTQQEEPPSLQTSKEKEAVPE